MTGTDTQRASSITIEEEDDAYVPARVYTAPQWLLDASAAEQKELLAPLVEAIDASFRRVKAPASRPELEMRALRAAEADPLPSPRGLMFGSGT